MLQELFPDCIAVKERNARHPGRVSALSSKPRSLKLPARAPSPDQRPLLVEAMKLWLSHDSVTCNLMQAGVFSLASIWRGTYSAIGF